jgi:hypothetical protein
MTVGTVQPKVIGVVVVGVPVKVVHLKGYLSPGPFGEPTYLTPMTPLSNELRTVDDILPIMRGVYPLKSFESLCCVLAASRAEMKTTP